MNPFKNLLRGRFSPSDFVVEQVNSINAAVKFSVEEKIFERFEFNKYCEFREKALRFFQKEWGVEANERVKVNFIVFTGGIVFKHIPLHYGLLFQREGGKEWFRFDLFKDEDETLYCECVKHLDHSSLDGPGDNNATIKKYFYKNTSLTDILDSTAKVMKKFGKFNIWNNNCITFVINILKDLEVEHKYLRNMVSAMYASYHHCTLQ